MYVIGKNVPEVEYADVGASGRFGGGGLPVAAQLAGGGGLASGGVPASGGALERAPPSHEKWPTQSQRQKSKHDVAAVGAETPPPPSTQSSPRFKMGPKEIAFWQSWLKTYFNESMQPAHIATTTSHHTSPSHFATTIQNYQHFFFAHNPAGNRIWTLFQRRLTSPPDTGPKNVLSNRKI